MLLGLEPGACLTVQVVEGCSGPVRELLACLNRRWCAEQPTPALLIHACPHPQLFMPIAKAQQQQQQQAAEEDLH